MEKVARFGYFVCTLISMIRISTKVRENTQGTQGILSKTRNKSTFPDFETRQKIYLSRKELS
jgi:hypothetical protein